MQTDQHTVPCVGLTALPFRLSFLCVAEDPAIMQKAQAMAQAMYGGGAGGAAGAGGMDELTRLRMENAALKGRAGA